MYKSIKTVIATNQPAWSTLPAFGTAVQTFNTRLAALEQSAYQQNLALVGVSAVKNAKRALVIERTYAISSGLVAYAVVNNDVELINQMKISRHELEKAGKTKLLLLVDRVLNRASGFVGQLDDYGIDQATVDELQTLRDELDAQLSAPRNAIIERKSQTIRIKTLVKEIDAIIKLQLDKLMEILKEDHPDFFTAYKNARVIVDHRNRSSNNDSSLPPLEGDQGGGQF